MTYERAQLYGVPETRDLALVDAEVRMNSAGDGMTFRGYASVFEVPYTVHDSQGEYTETARRGCFDRSLADGADVVFLVDHEGAPLARTKSGTLQLRTDARGLLAEARLDRANPRALELRSMVDRGDMDEMSFTFRDLQPTWNASYTERQLREVSIHHGDVSAVAFGANAATKGTLAMRSRLALAELRAKYSSAQLQAMLKAGKALKNPAGEPSYPIGDEADLRLAIHAVGRGSGDHDKIRAYIIGRAVALGLGSLIPGNWNKDGSLQQSNSAAWLGEYRATVFVGCGCCPPCSGSTCDGSCCDACDGAQLKAANSFLSVYNSDLASSNMDQPSAEALALAKESLEIRRRVLRLKIGEEEFRAAERRVRAAREPLPGESRAAFAMRQRADAIVARFRAEQRGVHR